MLCIEYNVTYSVVRNNSLLLTVVLFYSVKTTLVYNDSKCSGYFMTL